MSLAEPDFLAFDTQQRQRLFPGVTALGTVLDFDRGVPVVIAVDEPLKPQADQVGRSTTNSPGVTASAARTGVPPEVVSSTARAVGRNSDLDLKAVQSLMFVSP